MPPLPVAQAIPPAVKRRLHTPLDAPATSCLHHLCPGRAVTAEQCDCALQLSSFYKEKHFFSLETRNVRIKFSKYCLVVTVQAGKIKTYSQIYQIPRI